MRPEKRKTRNPKAICLDPEDSASGQYGESPSPVPTPTQELHSLLRRNPVRKDVAKLAHVRFLEPLPSPAKKKKHGSPRTRANIAQLSPDDARSQLPVKKRTPHLLPLSPSLPKRKSLILQKEKESSQPLTPSHPPLGFFKAPPRGPLDSNGNAHAQKKGFQRRASLMGVTDLDLSGEKYKGIDPDPDPFDMPGQHWAAKDMPTSVVATQMAVRNGLMNGKFVSGYIDAGEVDVGVNDAFAGGVDLGGTGLLDDLGLEGHGLEFGMGGTRERNRGVAGLSGAWTDVWDGTCSGSFVDLGESEGWSGYYGVPTHLRQPVNNGIGDEQPSDNPAAEIQGAEADQSGDFIPADTMVDTPNISAPLYGPQDLDAAGPAVDMEDIVSEPLPDPFSCTPSIMHLPAEHRDDILYSCKRDDDGGIRMPERNSEARMELEQAIRVRRYLVKDEKIWFKDFNSGTFRTVKSWMWEC